MRRILLDILILSLITMTIWYVYNAYGEQISFYMFGEQQDTVFIENVAVQVSVADDPDEWARGLAGVSSLRELEGMLFVFDYSDRHGIWMKDMRIPIDIIWVNDRYEVVHIERNVQPNSYPTTYQPNVPARFVLEVRAFFADTFSIEVGDTVSLPTGVLPDDLKERVVDEAVLQ